MIREGEKDKWGLLKVYARNSMGGRKAFREASVRTFPEDDERAERNYFMSIGFTPESEEKIRSLTARIEQSAAKHGIPLILSGKDFRIHSTLQGGTFKNADLQSRWRAYAEIYSDPEILRAAEHLKGLELTYKYLIANRDSITLNADTISPEIQRFRDVAKKTAERVGATPPSGRSILHMTLARITELPDSAEEKLQAFLKEMLELRREISRDPLRLTADRVDSGPMRRTKRSGS